MNHRTSFTVALAGNPNVGKSTVFNALTGMRQHTGNWPGKTVERKSGTFRAGELSITLVDVPGTYSLEAKSPEEALAAEYLTGSTCSPPDGVIALCDACCLERGLDFAMKLMKKCPRTVLCINMMDEAARRGISVDCEMLESLLGVPVIATSAGKGEGLTELKDKLCRLLCGDSEPYCGEALTPKELCRLAVTSTGEADRRDRLLDRIFTGKYTAYPAVALLLGAIFFITLRGAAPLSDGLSFLLGYPESGAKSLLNAVNCPRSITSLVCDGILRVLFWVIAVMLPPMAIFFPLFTLIEDLGYLPRIAYNFDSTFRHCGSCGKQSLTMMMGFGCNAVGVTGCRIIDSPRERLIACLTNAFVPCNGRFPVLAVFLTVAARGKGNLSGLLLCLAVAAGCVMTLAVSKLLSVTLLRGESSSFTLELPPYRLPRVGSVITRSLIDRTLKVLGRAAAVAAPAGVVIWCLGNIGVGEGNLFSLIADALSPAASVIGMDGVMLLAFILALPAAEITVPLMLMGYTASASLTPTGGIADSALLLSEFGWGVKTAICAAAFTLFHFPCSTTLITVHRETGKIKWTVAAALIPTAVGVIICAAVNLIFP
ncbi:MAG: ferrous iron transporter B [Clostridia bacterium]|nr:ferrous iron transporter B [Clostridia bacterium]